MFSTTMFAQLGLNGIGIPWPLVTAVVGGILFFSFILLLARATNAVRVTVC